MRFAIILMTIIMPVFVNSQKVDLAKLEKIGVILCNCLENNVDKVTNSRIDDCGYVLSEGLSVIKSDTLKYLYSSKADTYLQKNCSAYLKILSKENPNSDIKLENWEEYNDLKHRNSDVDFDKMIRKRYLYRDFIGDSIYVDIDKDIWIEKSSMYNTTNTFSIEKSELQPKLIFLNSDEDFFNDYYAKNESIDFILTKEKRGYRLFLNFANGIVLSKRLWTVDGNNTVLK